MLESTLLPPSDCANNNQELRKETVKKVWTVGDCLELCRQSEECVAYTWKVGQNTQLIVFLFQGKKKAEKGDCVIYKMMESKKNCISGLKN